VTTRADIEKHLESLKIQLLEYQVRRALEPLDARSHIPSEILYRIEAGTGALRLFDELGVVDVLSGGVIREAKP